MVWLKVSKRRTYWGYEDLWLTSMDPKPREVDIDDLTLEAREAILTSLQAGDLIEVDENGEEKEIAMGEKEPIKPISLDISPVIEVKAKELLKGGVTSIKREVAYSRNPLLLSAASTLERANKKPRKTVISILEKRLLALSGGGERFDYLPFLETEKGETVTLKRGDSIVLEEEEVLGEKEIG